MKNEPFVELSDGESGDRQSDICHVALDSHSFDDDDRTVPRQHFVIAFTVKHSSGLRACM